MNHRYIYLDETTFGECDEYCGYGSLITESQITNIVINEALKNLQGDPDMGKGSCKKQDHRTLDRQYFHAGDDSKNGHSHLCRSINKHVLGRFHYNFFQTRQHHFQDAEEAYSLASKLSLLSIFLSL